MIGAFLDFVQRRYIWQPPERALKLYEKVPRIVLERFRIMNLRHTVRLASVKSVFYSAEFEKYAVEVGKVSSPKDLFPITTSEKDLVGSMANRFICARPDTAFESTGTTSKTPKRIFFSNRELEDAGRIGAAGLWRLGVRPEDRAVSSFDYSFWVSGPALKSALNLLGAFHIEAGRMDPADFYDRVKSYQCNVIVSDPGWLVRLSEVADRKGPWPVKLLIAGGENLSEVSRKYVESVWQAKLLLSYGQTEAFGMIGLECSEQAGYHVNDMDLWVEIPTADREGYGELVYTTLRRSVMPLLRYRSGDVTRLITEPCRCGMASMRLAKLKGRADDLAVTSVGNIAPWMFDEAMEACGLRAAEWQVRLSQEGKRDRIEFWAELGSSVTPEDLRSKILDGMKQAMPVAFGGIEQGLAEFSAVPCAAGKLRQGRKVRRILDGRDFGNKTGELTSSAHSIAL